MVQVAIIKSRVRVPSNSTLHYFLLAKCEDDKQLLLKTCGLTQVPDRRTIDRRFPKLPLAQIISRVGNRMISEGTAEGESASAGSSMIKAAGPVWHKSDTGRSRLPASGTDAGARWGRSKSKGRVFGRKLHMSCSTGKPVVPLSAGVSTASVHDSSMREQLAEPLSGMLRNALCDPAYDSSKLREFSSEKNLRLVAPVRRYRSTPPDRVLLAEFYSSAAGQELRASRKVSVEPLFGVMKDTFGIRTVPVKGFGSVRSFVLNCVLVYQLAVRYNCLTGNENPRFVKRMLGC